MRNFMTKIWHDKRGNALVIAAAALPMLVGSAGLATDTIQWSLWKRQLQRAADSAALAGVYTRINTNTLVAVQGAVTADLAINYHVATTLRTGFPNVTIPADDGNKQKRVRVVLAMQKNLPFSSVFVTAPVITATATAASVPGAGEFCVLATDPSSTTNGITITGSTNLDLGTCSLMANSSNPTAAATNGNNGSGGSGSRVIAASLAAVGGVNYSGQWAVTDYDPNSPSVADPFAGKSPPACTKNVTIDMTKNQSYPMDRTTGAGKDVAGDVVCFNGAGGNKVGVTVQGALKLQTGVSYVVNGGDLTMNSTGSSLTCTECTIFLTNTATPANTGNIKITGGTLSVTAPLTGTYSGIAIFQDRRATDGGGSQNVIQGNNGASVTGAVYMGNRGLTYTGGSNTVYACVQIVSKRVTFTGNSAMKVTSQCPGKGMSPLGGGRRVRLVA